MKYFKFSELTASATAERLAIDNTPPRVAQQMLTVLVEQLLDPIRRRYGAPIIVTSGFRCPALNTAVGGVANSHHIIGCAADITAGSIEQNRVLFALIIEMQAAHAIRFTQLIAEKGYRWLHISYVPGMLRNQVIDVNDDVNVNDNQPSGSQEGDVVALLSEAKASAVATDAPSASASALSLSLRDYQDSG